MRIISPVIYANEVGLEKVQAAPSLYGLCVDFSVVVLFGSHYSFRFLLSCRRERVKFVAFERFGSEPVPPQNGGDTPLPLWPHGSVSVSHQAKCKRALFPPVSSNSHILSLRG